MIAVIAEEAADTAAHAELVGLLRQHVTLLRSPVMRKEATAELGALRHLLGKNQGKQGALGQTGKNGALTHFRELNSPLGMFMADVNDAIARVGAEKNAFMRLNSPNVRRPPPARHGPTGRH